MAEAQQWFEEAQKEAQKGNWAEAEVKLKAAVERYHLEAWIALGIVQKNMGKITEALETFEKGAYEGILQSQVKLIELLHQGIGQPNNERNYKKAYFWAYLVKDKNPNILGVINSNTDASDVLTDEVKRRIEAVAEEHKLKIAERTKMHPPQPPPTPTP
jgi:hypothetical protein